MITIPAFAKINWSLSVIGRREDGYHEIDTAFQTISLHDTIKLTPKDDPTIVLSCDDRTLPVNSRNLAWRAAVALQAREPSKGAHLRLEKRIPAQAGLGGGSSNAAATLLGLAHLWQTEVAPEELLEIAAGLGADVPFFLCGGSARGRGKGSEVTPLEDAPEQLLLVLKPRAYVSTELAYQELNAPFLTTLSADIMLSGSADSDNRHGATDRLSNDFEPVLLRLKPEIKRAKTALLKAGAQCALLAGSGSAVFGVFENREAQERAIQTIDLETGWRIFPCRTMGRKEYRSALGPSGARAACVPGSINAGA